MDVSSITPNTRRGTSGSLPAESTLPIRAGNVTAVIVSLFATMLGRGQKAIPLAHPWYDARTAGWKGMQIVMPVWSSVSGSSPAIKLLSRKSLMLLCDVQGGKRNLQVLPSPRKPKAKVGHLPILQGMERATSMAPLRMDERLSDIPCQLRLPFE